MKFKHVWFCSTRREAASSREAAGGSPLLLLVLGLVDGGPWGTLRRRSLGPAHNRIETPWEDGGTKYKN